MSIEDLIQRTSDLHYRNIEAIRELAKLATRRHYWCDDSYYSCPANEEGCSNPAYEDTKECQCGADEHNENVIRLLSLLGVYRIDAMSSYFEAMRKLHPVKLGEVIDGKRVVETFWQWTPENGDVPMYRVEGDSDKAWVNRERSE